MILIKQESMRLSVMSPWGKGIHAIIVGFL
jgi:hypothetical protein